MKFSQFGQKFTRKSGILQLMDDLGKALASAQPVLMLGGGNPSQIPEIQTYLRQRIHSILANGNEFERMLGNYDAPQGFDEFNQSVAELLKQQYGWQITAKNVALTNGSQAAFFTLFNLFAGHFQAGQVKKILLPLAPEYIGYRDIGLSEDFFVACAPIIEHLPNRLFKYHVDFSQLKIDDSIGAMCVSRPTNPTGNMLTNEEIHGLAALARQHDIPLIIDAAYGTPFPNISFTEVEPYWDENIILCLSLSKLGLPGSRTGIIIGNEAVIDAVSRVSAILTLAPNSVGAVMALEMVRTGDILRLSQEIIRPYYEQKMQQAVAWIHQYFEGMNYHLHKPEGAFFLWLWFEGLSISSQALYEQLKQSGVLVIPSQYFFVGLENMGAHVHECIRISYAQPSEVIEAGIRLIAQQVRPLMR